MMNENFRYRFIGKGVDSLILLLLIWLFGSTGLIVGVTYILLSDTGTGFSVGKKIMGLKVLTEDGKPPSIKASVIRNLTIVPSFLSIYIPIIGIIFSFIAIPLLLLEIYLLWTDPGGQRLGDLLASTKVVIGEKEI